MSAIKFDTDDEEIIEIFVEEAGEVLQEIDRNLKTLKGRPTDRTALTELRRGFHTLKGSGRMAKALDLGELAWKIENMLNRAIEGKIEVSEALLGLVTTCHATIPQLVQDFQGRRRSDLQELEILMSHADAIANGQTQLPSAPRGAAAPPPPAASDELVRRVDQTARRTDEALHRSEMALQHARRVGSQLDAVSADIEDRRSSSEVKPLLERINTLSRDIMELREINKGRPSEAGPTPRELQHLIDQRVRDRTAAAERARVELEQRLEEALQSAAAARRTAAWALSVAILLAIGVGTFALMALGQ